MHAHSPLSLLPGFHFLDPGFIGYGTVQTFKQSQVFQGNLQPPT